MKTLTPQQIKPSQRPDFMRETMRGPERSEMPAREKQKMNHWLLDNIAEKRIAALNIVDQIQTQKSLNKNIDADWSLLLCVSNALELATIDLIPDAFEGG